MWPPERTDILSMFAGFVAVFATSAGLYSISTTPTTTPTRGPGAAPEREVGRG